MMMTHQHDRLGMEDVGMIFLDGSLHQMGDHIRGIVVLLLHLRKQSRPHSESNDDRDDFGELATWYHLAACLLVS
jgi:hypothetical protein